VPRAVHLKNLDRLRDSLGERGLGGLIVGGGGNLLYLLGSDAPLLALIPLEGEPVLVANRLEFLRAAEEAVTGYVITYVKDEVPLAPYEDAVRGDVYDALRHAVERANLQGRQIGFTAGAVQGLSMDKVAAALGTQPIDVTDLLRELRSVKSLEEIRLIERAVEVTEAAINRALSSLEPGVRECEVAAVVEYEMRRRGAAPAFEPIIAFGEHAAHPHARVGEKELRRSDLVKVDVGAKVECYCADITRTVLVGEPQGEAGRMLRAVLAAQQEALEAIKAGLPASEPDRRAREAFRRLDVLQFFNHGLGHGLGVDVHESPALSASSRDVMRENMVVTVEPGLYVRGWGGVRVEDDVVVGEDGPRLLTSLDRELLLEL